MPARASGSGLVLRDESSHAKVVLKNLPESARSRLQVGFGSSTVVMSVLVVGHRPDEWVLVGPGSAVDALLESLPLGQQTVSVDHTHAWLGFRLVGESSAAVMAKLCNLDLGDAMTPNGAAVLGVLARINCDIVRADIVGCRGYLLMADRSYGQYLFDALLDAGDEFEIAVGE